MLKTAVLRRLRKEEKGFTLIELLAVIVILGVIAAIAIPLIGNIIDKSKKDSDIATARQVYDATRMYVTSELNSNFKGGTSDLVISVGDLQGKGYLDAKIALPSTKNALSPTASLVTFDKTSGNLTTIVLVDSALKSKSYIADEVLSATSTK